ncbi:hypothetical protein F2Q69_00009099 [Brassica cretica]|uniref:Uncharacterized protein n=1 Tax=Brassica cretica TaxID=69181 RepID=A0A8S9PI80_BRACR|nr:hypothetical protein F2Q69_00009099 [Brassica cretica]
MNFSHNNLQRPIPRSTQFQRQNCSAFMDNPRLYGLEDICGKTHVPNPTPQESEDLFEPKEQVISWISAGIAYGPGVFCGEVMRKVPICLDVLLADLSHRPAATYVRSSSSLSISILELHYDHWMLNPSSL